PARVDRRRRARVGDGVHGRHVRALQDHEAGARRPRARRRDVHDHGHPRGELRLHDVVHRRLEPAGVSSWITMAAAGAWLAVWIWSIRQLAVTGWMWACSVATRTVGRCESAGDGETNAPSSAAIPTMRSARLVNGRILHPPLAGRLAAGGPPPTTNL